MATTLFGKVVCIPGYQLNVSRQRHFQECRIVGIRQIGNLSGRNDIVRIVLHEHEQIADIGSMEVCMELGALQDVGIFGQYTIIHNKLHEPFADKIDDTTRRTILRISGP